VKGFDVMEMEKFNAKAFFIFMGIILLLCIGARFAQEFSAEQEKNHEIRMELTRSNVKVAEDMVAKELNTDIKNFRMTAVPGDLLNRSYWITKELVSEIKKKDGEEYRIYFEKKRVRNSEGVFVMYKPTGIYKILKEE
jgi:putative component of toxin-antitoxin plasmid stabilization module